ncbi:MAG TPA: hypothetical protein VJZ00_23690 [Thermoanaerobaculia bacterium]|nr:hypothetical protein [Thermoanaerobaculia bacterium]
MRFQLGFFNASASVQDWALLLDGVSIATFTLQPNTGTPRYVNIDIADGKSAEVTVDTATGNAAAKLTNNGGTLRLTSHTPNEFRLDQETRSQYLVTCTLA